MNTFAYKIGWIHETFLHPSQMTANMINGVKAQIGELVVHVKSVHAAKCFITRVVNQTPTQVRIYNGEKKTIHRL